MTQPPDFRHSQSATSLSRFYHGSNGASGPNGGADEISDPKLDFCNAFWGQGDRGYEVLMARLRGATRTTEELRTFWKERAAIEDDYAKRLARLSKTTLGKDEIGDLSSSLQHVLNETNTQASYHQSLSTELKQMVEQPTAEFGLRLNNLKKGLQSSIDKAWKNKGLQEGHLAKAKERYESDALKLNSYSTNTGLVQGRELDKVQGRLERVRQTIGGNEQDYRQLTDVLKGTQRQWESEWKGFCDHVQDIEEDRLALVKDVIWAYANAVSQVCVDDDSSCERVREKLEQFEPHNDMLAFVRGWGTGDTIQDPPKFINYSAGETFSSGPTFHQANFRRISSKPPPSATSTTARGPQGGPNGQAGPPQPPAMNGDASQGLPNMGGLNIVQPGSTMSPTSEKRTPFGGVALPGMTLPAPPASGKTDMPPPPVPASIAPAAEPRSPSRAGASTPRHDDDDPMARAMASLRREPPPPDSVRRNASNRRPDSVYSNTGSAMGQAVKSPASPGPGSLMSPNAARSSSPAPLTFQPPRQPSPAPQAQPARQPSPAPAPQSQRPISHQPAGSIASHQSIDSGLLPPASGHTAAALAKSMDDFQRNASRDRSRQSVNYSNFADDIVGAHPSSRPSTPSAPINRAPSPAMMQAPQQPATHIADSVLSQYHQAFPGERSRSRANSAAGSITSHRSRANSFNSQAPPPEVQGQQQQEPPTSPSVPRDGFAGIGARGRSPSPAPMQYRSPSPNPTANQGSLGPQNIGISLDEKGGVAHDSMAEAYRRQYQQQQAQQRQGQPPQQQQQPPPPSQPSMQQFSSLSGAQQPAQPQQPFGSQYGQPPAPGNRPVSSQGSLPNQQPGFGQPPQQQYGQNQQPSYQAQQQQSPPPQQQQQYYPSYTSLSQPQQPSSQPYQQQQQQQPPVSSPPPAQPQYGGQNSYTQQQYGYQQQSQQQQPPPQHQQQYAAPAQAQNQYARTASPAPQQGGYGYGGQPQQQAPQQQPPPASPSPQPGQVPTNPAPTGQWSTTGQPVLFYVKALYDYTAQSAAEFDFQAGDIIAVTSTPDDGWWSGELLDEARRVPGRNDFPSNFVCLF